MELDDGAAEPPALQLPLSKVKKICRLDPDVHMVSADAVNVLAFACVRSLLQRDGNSSALLPGTIHSTVREVGTQRSDDCETKDRAIARYQ
jgi:hypothetical protein